ncbi:MAG TPA: aspartyl protease family protein [Pyrinomonadaceae bacterium]|nr:aspartyl protease family protein [Pyrinomonadaceae bacterium]
MSSKRKLLFAVILSLAAGMRAVSFGAALFVVPEKSRQVAPRLAVPRPVSFREVNGRGLLTTVWINSSGPYTFAIDTGAGATLVSARLAAQLGLESRAGRSISGLSGITTAAREARIRSLAMGDRANFLPGKLEVVVTSGLPADIDGVIDPTEAFSPLGYIIDIPRHELSAFDPREIPLSVNNQPEGGAVVTWLRESQGRRPFVQLDNGDRALIDTGSNLGLAIRDSARSRADDRGYIQDIGGGRIATRRVRPTTVAIGALILRNVPTDLVSGTHADAPVLLGLSALRPFKISFDPVHRLIEIEPPRERY